MGRGHRGLSQRVRNAGPYDAPVPGRSPIMPASVVGSVGEDLVQAYAMISSGGRLLATRPGLDIDHKDLIVDERGGYQSFYLQVKCRASVDPDGRILCQAQYPEGAIPSSDRLAYVCSHLDISQMRLDRLWLVPSRDFNRLANRIGRRPGRIELEFETYLSGGGKWGEFL